MKNLRALRERAHLSQSELARLAEVALPELPQRPISVQYINDLEKERNTNPSALAAMRIADVLGCAIKELFLPSEDAA